jgi:hypothetical protein
MTSRPRWENRTVNEDPQRVPGSQLFPSRAARPSRAGRYQPMTRGRTHTATPTRLSSPIRPGAPTQRRSARSWHGGGRRPGLGLWPWPFGWILPKLAQLPKGPSVVLAVGYAVLSIWSILQGAAHLSHRRLQHTNNSTPNHLHKSNDRVNGSLADTLPWPGDGGQRPDYPFSAGAAGRGTTTPGRVYPAGCRGRGATPGLPAARGGSGRPGAGIRSCPGSGPGGSGRCGC